MFKDKLLFIGIIVGAIGGFLYYKYVGCSTGTCPITSNLFTSSGYGAVMGALIFSMFKPESGQK